MEELASFFDGLCPTEDLPNCKFIESASRQNQPRKPVFTQLSGGVTENKHELDSSFASHASHAFLRSSSSPCMGNLPLILPPEPEEGNIEYKLKLINPNSDRFEHLMTQMKWRLNEGGGQAIYRLGVDDNGAVTGLTAKEMSASLLTLYKMAQRLGVDLRLSRECTLYDCKEGPKSTPHLHRKAIELHAKWKASVNQGTPDMRVAMLGSVDVGKSTLLGVLTDGEMDDGRGRARLSLFRHLHEVQSGRTSSLSSELIGFDAEGHLINRRRSQGQLNKRTVAEVIRDSSRLITFLDLAGHSKYQRTTLSGLTTFQPAFCILVVAATTGLTPEGLCHARIAAVLGLPIAVVLSKVDLTSERLAALPQRRISIASAEIENEACVTASPVLANIRRRVLQELKAIKFYSNAGGECNFKAVECFHEEPPVFAVSSVSGFGVGDLLNFLAEVSSKSQYEGLVAPKLTTRTDFLCEQSLNNLVECWVTKVFSKVPGVCSPVLEVLVKLGQVYKDQRLWLGPDEEGLFHPIRVVELRHNRHPHHILYKGQWGSLLAVAEPPDEVGLLPRRGMVVVNAEPVAGCSCEDPPVGVCWSFCISHLIWMAPTFRSVCLQHNSTVGIHAGNVLQYARVLETTFSCDYLTRVINSLQADSDSVILRLEPSHKVVVTFLRQPEFLEMGRQVVISVNNVAIAVGAVAGFGDVLTAFSKPPPQLSKSSPLKTSDTFFLESVVLPPSSSWHAVSDLPSDSYETLLLQIGIDPQGPRTTFIDEPPLPPELETLEELPNLNKCSKRRQRHTKRRRKTAARLALMMASSAEVTSSTSALNNNSNGSASFLGKQVEDEVTNKKIGTETSQRLTGSTIVSPTCITSERRRKRKRRHKR